MSPRLRKLLVAAVCLAAASFLLVNTARVGAAAGDLDTSFDPGDGADSLIRTSAF